MLRKLKIQVSNSSFPPRLQQNKIESGGLFGNQQGDQSSEEKTFLKRLPNPASAEITQCMNLNWRRSVSADPFQIDKAFPKWNKTTTIWTRKNDVK